MDDTKGNNTNDCTDLPPSYNNIYTISGENNFAAKTDCQEMSELKLTEEILAEDNTEFSQAPHLATNYHLAAVSNERNRYKRYGLEQYSNFFISKINNDKKIDVKNSFEMKNTSQYGHESGAINNVNEGVLSETVEKYDELDAAPAEVANNAEQPKQLKYIKKRLNNIRQAWK